MPKQTNRPIPKQFTKTKTKPLTKSAKRQLKCLRTERSNVCKVKRALKYGSPLGKSFKGINRYFIHCTPAQQLQLQAIFECAKPEKQEFTRKLRAEATCTELRLLKFWRRAQWRELAAGFQIPIAGYIVDFYLPEYKLVVELDGGYHKTRRAYDDYRTKVLEAQGLRVIRFDNEAVVRDPNRVMHEIYEAALGYRIEIKFVKLPDDPAALKAVKQLIKEAK